MKKVLCIYSGGLDSTTGLYKMVNDFGNDNVHALTFLYGSKHNHKELDNAKWHTKHLDVKHKVVDISNSFLSLLRSDLLISGGDIPHGHYEADNMKDTVVPFRNGIFLALAAGYADSNNLDSIVLSNHAGDHVIYPDCTIDFTNAMAQAIKLGTDNLIEFNSPFVDIRKEDIVTIGTKLGIDYTKTWSCYEGKDEHCGKCGTCVERKEAFKLAGITDPTIYRS